MTVSYLSSMFGLSDPTVIKILNEFRVKRHKKTKIFSPDLDEQYFDSIDTEKKAYFLGLIFTDGCIHMSKGRQPLCGITLKEQDEYILKEFKNDIRSNKTVTHDGRGCSEINILSSGIVSGLRKYGVKERKSTTILFPNNIPEDMMGHFIRGVFDGDGSAAFYSRKGRKSHTKGIIFCSGSYQFLSDMV